MNQTRTFSKNAQKDFNLIDHIILYKSENACSELMGRYKKSVYYMILKKVPNQQDAEDLTIETFAKAFHKLALFKKFMLLLLGFFASLPTIPSILCEEKKYRP